MVQILIILVPVIVKLIEKFVPDQVTRTKPFHAKRRVITRLTTISDIAKLRKAI